MGDDEGGRVDAQEPFAQGLDLGPADIGQQVVLPVQVGGVDHVAVEDLQVPEAGAHERDSDVGAQAAGPGDTDALPLDQPELFVGQVAGEGGFEWVHLHMVTRSKCQQGKR